MATKFRPKTMKQSAFVQMVQSKETKIDVLCVQMERLPTKIRLSVLVSQIKLCSMYMTVFSRPKGASIMNILFLVFNK